MYFQKGWEETRTDDRWMDAHRAYRDCKKEWVCKITSSFFLLFVSYDIN